MDVATHLYDAPLAAHRYTRRSGALHPSAPHTRRRLGHQRACGGDPGAMQAQPGTA
ncbi:conserved hypothetical protein [Xanthomonas citri pv. fuscans]|uniref:Uncharacterized protein n=1 Tax=Xanthomonas campestris pv. phaseoli TaxID=317013 RepID=A0A7Z7IX54_XANCH|nr:conserved hypothetical protein [Xanthomonas citri pv. fuscans]SOO23241.1 conserved hypothetical protein [Xanthomonas phaseoli pv. phaseoli]